MTPIEKLNEEAAVKKLEIERKRSDDLLAKIKSEEERLALSIAEQNELKAVGLELDQKKKNLQKQATASIDEEIKRLEAVLAGKEEEYKWEKMIADLKAKGAVDAEAKVNRLRELTAEAEATRKPQGSI